MPNDSGHNSVYDKREMAAGGLMISIMVCREV